ncbi:MAG: tetratricopeptide repeat protein, partial [Tannerellaceae bacterium]
VEVEISAYASPDGTMSLNTALSEKREKNTNNYLSREFKKGKIDAPISARYTAEDWEGFKELVEKSNIQDKDLVLRVLEMYSDPEQRDQEIKNMSSVFSVLAEEILPKLRRSRLTANIEIIGKSDEEISNLVASNPGALNVEEILYAATLTPDLSQKAAIYKKTTELYPKDYRAYNNIGMLLFEQGDLDGAKKMFDKAAQVSPSTPETYMNLGLISLVNGDKAKAQQYFGNAAGVAELNEALGVLYLEQGEYAKAVNAFGPVKTNNAALAQILTKDYSKAQATLNAIDADQADATTDYLKAIVAARTNNVDGVVSNLKAAILKDRSMAKEAASDLEFAKFATNSAFSSLVK